MNKYLGIDIGGTAVKMGIVDETGNILISREASVSFDNYNTPILETVLAESEAFLDKNLRHGTDRYEKRDRGGKRGKYPQLGRR